MPDLRNTEGKPITEETLGALAAEAEAGYDPTLLRPRRTGRPSLGSGTSPRIQFRVSPRVYEAALRQAQAEERTLSELARSLLEVYVRGARSAPRPARGKRARTRAADRQP